MKHRYFPFVLLLMMGLGWYFFFHLHDESGEDKSVIEVRKELEMNQTEEKEILALLDRVSKAVVEKDRKTLEALLPEDYVLTHMTGYRQPRNEWLDEIENANMEYFGWESAASTHPKIVIADDTATVSSIATVDARINGYRRKWSLSSTAYFKKRGNKWVLQATDAS